MTKNIYCQCLGCTTVLRFNQPKFCSLSCSTKEKNRVSTNKKIMDYNLNPNHCLHCRKKLDYEHRKNKFCSHSCSASKNNPGTKRGPKKDPNSNAEIKRHKKLYPYSRVEPRICENTGKIWWYNGRHRRLSPYRKSLKEQYYDKCAFKFNVYHYPDIFDLSLIEKHGWYSCPGRKRGTGIKNTNGVSRDHKVSRKEAFENSYDPYYISHIMNCDLILHSENKIKHSKSSLAYEDLVRLVIEYDNNERNLS